MFAGRPYKKGEIVLPSWMTLTLPENFPRAEVATNYLFPPTSMVLDYGSIANHHESANTEAARVTGSDNIDFYVRRARARVRVTIRASA